MKKGSKSSPLRVRRVLIELGNDPIYAEILLSGYISSGSEAMEVATALQIDPPTLVVQQAAKKAVLPGQAGTVAQDTGTPLKIDEGDKQLFTILENTGTNGPDLPFAPQGKPDAEAVPGSRAEGYKRRVAETQGKKV